MRIAFAADDRVRAAITRIGRTEDAQFSPDGKRLALAGVTENRLLILEVEAELEAPPSRIALTACCQVRSASLKAPHGLFWIDDRTLVVANREGEVTIFELPADRRGSEGLNLVPVRCIGADLTSLVKTPGSVSVSPVGLGLVELLVCNNFLNHVSRHLLDQRDGYALVASEILLDQGFDVPDGVAHSPSGRWIAVSNHNHHCVFVFRNDGDLNRAGAPRGVLRGVSYPHGLRFSADERSLLVADAGAPHAQLFRSDEGDWGGEREPSASIQVVSDEVFRRGNWNPREGGPKGIDVTRCGRLMVATCEEQPLAFFDVRALLPQTTAVPAPPNDAAEADRAREALLRYLSAHQSSAHAATEAIRRSSEWDVHMLQVLRNSRSWRITAPLRRIAATLRGVDRRRRRGRGAGRDR